MVRPYGLISDLHAFNWSAFASVDATGRNTRLMDIIYEINRCCQETIKAGGNHVYIAGDVFHTRGSITPSVFNPLKILLDQWEGAIMFVGIAGNHDLESKDSKALTSAVEMLSAPNVSFYHRPTSDAIILVPWVPNSSDYMQAIAHAVDSAVDPSKCDLICHIGIDGTLAAMPDHGADAAFFKSLGVKRVFSGHYHHYKDFGDGVYSIGAATHQTWSDVGTQAGFLIVHPTHVQRFASHAPSFIQITGDEDPDELPEIVDGHFVKARLGECDPKAVSAWREQLVTWGAKGVIIEAQAVKADASRAGVTTKSISAIDQSVADYATEKGMKPEVSKLCLDILSEARSV